jgi:hypothetical protein
MEETLENFHESFVHHFGYYGKRRLYYEEENNQEFD